LRISGAEQANLGQKVQVKIWAHKQLARSRFYEAKILTKGIDLVDWGSVYAALHGVPQLFQIWACKQVMGIVGANGNRPWETNLDTSSLSCQQARESCGHVLSCNHARRVEALMMSIDLMGTWMMERDIDPVLTGCITWGRGHKSLFEICCGEGEPYK
jgi:hypothetical protein